MLTPTMPNSLVEILAKPPVEETTFVLPDFDVGQAAAVEALVPIVITRSPFFETTISFNIFYSPIVTPLVATQYYYILITLSTFILFGFIYI
tara:strand:- start:2312 stop:2587 length:276 start_codon:yes stop_codon:yes gene_type:complete